MAGHLDFAPAAPDVVAAALDDASVHVWRLRHAVDDGRAPLRHLLSAYLGIDAADLVLAEADRGKPHIAHAASGLAAADASPLEFNWSHSGEWALVALARGLAVGIDVERLGKPVRATALAGRFFDPSEAAALAAVDAAELNRAFTSLWCAKEAVLKASGVGISFGLDRLAFARQADVDWVLERLDPVLGTAPEWQLHGFAAAPGYRGVLAWRGGPRGVRAFEPG